MEYKIPKLASLIQQQEKPCLIKQANGSLVAFSKKTPQDSYITINNEIFKISELESFFKHSGFEIIIREYQQNLSQLEVQQRKAMCPSVLGITSEELASYVPTERPNVCQLDI